MDPWNIRAGKSSPRRHWHQAEGGGNDISSYRTNSLNEGAVQKFPKQANIKTAFWAGKREAEGQEDVATTVTATDEAKRRCGRFHSFDA